MSSDSNKKSMVRRNILSGENAGDDDSTSSPWVKKAELPEFAKGKSPYDGHKADDGWPMAASSALTQEPAINKSLGQSIGQTAASSASRTGGSSGWLDVFDLSPWVGSAMDVRTAGAAATMPSSAMPSSTMPSSTMNVRVKSRNINEPRTGSQANTGEQSSGENNGWK